MTSVEPQPAALPPKRPWFQFDLRTLLLIFFVLASSMAVFGLGGIAVFALIGGLAVWIRRVKSLWSLSYLALAAPCLMCILGFPPNSGNGPSPSSHCKMNLMQIAAALRIYHDVNGCFPPAYVADKNGKPMCSWRVLILPYLELDPLYKAYDFSEPWDSPKNKSVSKTHLRDFVCPSDPLASAADAYETSYVAVVGPNSAWAGEKSRKQTDIDDTSETIMVVEVANSGISWAEPRDLTVGETKAASKLPALTVSSNHGWQTDFFFTYDHGTGANVAMVDGEVHYLQPDVLSAENLPKLLQIGGGKEDQMDRNYQEPPRHLNWPNIAALAVWLLSVAALLTHAVRSRRTSH